MSDEFQPVFSQDVIAVLVASIVASIIDPVDDADLSASQHAQPPDEPLAEHERVAASLASLMSHFETRVQELEGQGMPDHLADQHRHLRLLLLETAAYQLSVVPPSDQPLQ